jgi:hypothetical protein
MRDGETRQTPFGHTHTDNPVIPTSLQHNDLASVLEGMKNVLDNIQSNVQLTRGTKSAEPPRATSPHDGAIPKRPITQKRGEIRKTHIRREYTSSSFSTEEFSDSDSSGDDSMSTAVVTQSRRSRRRSSYKLPPFTGQDKEKWVVWRGRFEEIADRAKWSPDEKLDELLPRMQGGAGEFVFGQLNKNTRSNYKKLVKELNNRYREVETKKSLEAKFSSRRQKPHESVEVYAADLKKLYAKAYPGRDESVRREDLLRKFFDGLIDEKVQFQVEYIKEPDNIDDAVFQVVNFCDMNRSTSKAERKTIRAVDTASDKSEQKKSGGQKELKGKNYQRQYEGLQEIKTQIQNLEQMLRQMNQSSSSFKGQQPTQNKNKNCHFCLQFGHFIRDCPLRFQQNSLTASDTQKTLQNNADSQHRGNLNSQGS